MKYFSHIFLSLLMFSISQKLLGDDRSVADTAAAEGSKNISTVAITAVKSDTLRMAKDSLLRLKMADSISVKKPMLSDDIKNKGTVPATTKSKKKSVKKAPPKPTPEELAIADFLSKLSVYTNDSLVAKKYAPPVDSTGKAIPYSSISEMLMKTPVSVNDSADAIPSPMFLSLIFENFEQELPYDTGIALKDTCLKMPDGKRELDIDDSCSRRFKPSNSELLLLNARIAAINRQPELVSYSKRDMPDVPVPTLVTRSMSKNRVSAIKPKDMPDGKELNLASPPKPKLWKHNFSSSVQVSQAYISENWYQGGESNFNIISDQLFSTSFDNKRKLIFTASVQWKLGVNTSPSDTCHAYKVNEDLFQVNSKFGIKAIKDWYYTVSLVFKTQFFNSYPANSNDKTASLLSPGELNLGVGMSYNKKIEERKFETSIMLSPLSYNLKFSLDKEIAALSGIPDEKLFQNQVGSSVEATFKWEFYPNLSWTARVFYFTNYKYAQSDIETGMDIAFNRYFSTKIYLHARYDDSIEKNKHGNYFQFKELLSFGFNYKFN